MIMNNLVLLFLVLITSSSYSFASQNTIGNYRTGKKNIKIKSGNYELETGESVSAIPINQHEYTSRNKTNTLLTLVLDQRRSFELNRQYDLLGCNDLNDLENIPETIVAIWANSSFLSNISPQGYVRFSIEDDNNIKAEFALVTELCSNNALSFECGCDNPIIVKGYTGELLIPREDMNITE